MSQALDIVADNQADAHQAVSLAWALGKQLTGEGRKFHIHASEIVDDRSLRQNRYYWGPCLREISEQASIGGQKWASDAWHELMKRQFLGYEIKKVRVAGRKKVTIIRRLRSTRSLSVAKFSKFLDQVQSFAATDLNVRFSFRGWEDYR